jgi:hypothetical protein
MMPNLGVAVSPVTTAEQVSAAVCRGRCLEAVLDGELGRAAADCLKKLARCTRRYNSKSRQSYYTFHFFESRYCNVG